MINANKKQRKESERDEEPCKVCVCHSPSCQGKHNANRLYPQ